MLSPAWRRGQQGTQARVGQTGCFLDEDKEEQGSLFLDCAFLLLLKTFKQWLKIQNVPYVREEGR